MTFQFRKQDLHSADNRRHRRYAAMAKRLRHHRMLGMENLEERRVMATSIFQEGVDNGFGIYSGGKDIEVKQNSATTPRPAGTGGANPVLSVDFTDAAPATQNTSEVLLRFDDIFGTGAGQIPLGAIIVSASLQVTTIDPGDGATFHRALVSWDEVNATWNSMNNGLQNDDSEATVGFNGFIGNSGRDDDEPVGTTVINITGDLRAWSVGANNYGWAIKPWNLGTNAWQFAPSEHPTTASRPKLIVEWLPADAQTANFRQGVGGYSGAVDTQLQQANATANSATAATLGIDKSDATGANEVQTLLRFDSIIGTAPGQIPPGSTIQYAYLDLVSSTGNSQGHGGQFFRMLSPWAETDNWTTLGDGANGRNTTPGVQNDGIEAQAGFTYSAGNAALSPLVRSGNNPFLVTSDLQAWVNGEANNGWAILPWTGGTNGWFINSSDAAEHLRPQLRVVYTPPVVEPVVNNLSIDAQGALQYSAGALLANNVTIALNAGNYTITDSAGPITLSATAIAAGWTGNGTTTVSGPSTSVQSLAFALGTSDDTAQVLSYDDALSIDAGANSGDVMNITTSILSGSDLTLSNFGQLNVSAGATINLGTAKLAVQSLAGVGTAAQPLRITVGAMSADGGAGGVYVVESDGAEVAATASGVGAIRLSALAGALTVTGLVAADSGNITLSSPDAVIVNGQVGDSGTLGQILIQANTDGIGSEGYLQGTAGILGTNNAGNQAIVIEVNQSASGSANAVVGPAVTAGDYVVRAQGGSVLWNPGFAIPAFNGANDNVVRANNYVLSSTSPTGSVGTLASPIQTDNLSSLGTATLSAGNGGIFLTDWGGADLNIAQAIATESGAVQLVAANAAGHNLTIAGTVTTGSGDIVVLVDDELTINGTIGGSGFSGKIRVQANRDAGNEQRILFGSGARIETSNATTEAILIDIAAATNAGSTAAGGILLNGLILSGNGGTITLNAAAGTAAGRSGKIEWIDGLINAGTNGTVDLRARYHYIGYAGFPIVVNAGHIIASTTAPPDTRGGAEEPGIFITAQSAANFTATGGSLAGASPLLGNIDLRTLTGKLTVAGPINTDGAATITLSGAQGVDIAGALGDADTTGSITINGNAGGIAFLSDLDVGTFAINLQAGTAAPLGSVTNISSAGSISAANGVVVGSGDVLVGAGTVNGTVFVEAGGKISPGGGANGRLTMSGLEMSGATAVYTAQITGLTADSEFDQLVVTGGPLQLSGALELALGFAPNVGDIFRLINNNSSAAVQGQFTQGTTLNIGPYQFSINYAGGDGNDVDLAPVSINAANQSPVLDNTGDMSLTGIRQGDRTGPGTLISQIIASAGGDRITDADTGALEGLAIIGADATNGTWEYSTDSTTWLALGNVSETTARVLSADAGTRIRFVPNKGYHGAMPAALTVRAWDRLIGGGNGDLVTVSVTGGTSPFSSATEFVSLVVSPLPLIYLNEMLTDAPGGDGGQEFIELRGVPNSVIPQGTYFVHLEGDLTANAGMLQSYIDLGGLTFGANGYLLLAQNSARYTPAVGATVVSGTGTWNSLADGRYVGSNDLENSSATAMLVYTSLPLTDINDVAVDIDSDNDGIANGTLWDSWEVLDSVGATDAEQAGDLAFGRINFINTVGNGQAPMSETTVSVSYASLASGYFGRIGDSTGWATSDWVAVRGNFSSSTPAPVLTLPATAADNTTPALFGALLNHLGASNAVAPVNQPPVINASATAITAEDIALLFTDIGVVDDDTSSLTLTLSTTNGALTLASTTALIVTGDGTALVNVSGTLANITSALNGLTFSPAANYNGGATLQLNLTDSGGLNDQATIAINVTAVNDAPSFVVAGDPPAIIAGAALQTVPGFATSIVAGPADESAQLLTFEVTLVGATGGLSFVGTPTINADGVLSYTPAGQTSGTATFQAVLADNGQTGTPHGNVSAPQTFTITVTPAPVNQAPVNTLPASATTNEDESIGLTGLLIADSDAGNSLLQTMVALPASVGTLVLVAQGSAVVSGSGTTSVQIDGSVADINATLATLIYQPATNFNGATSLTIATTDFALSDSDVLTLQVSAVNDEPIFALPGNPPTVTENAGAQTVSNLVTGLSAGPADESSQTLTIITTVTASTGGLTFATAPTIDAATGTLTYAATFGTSGTATISVVVTDSGSDAAPNDNTSVTRTLVITVTPAPINLAPVNTLPVPPTIAEDHPLAITGITVADSDSASLRTTLSIPSGTGSLTVNPQGGAAISGSGTTTVQIEGSAAAINATLATLNFAPAANFQGGAELTIATTDFSLTDTDTLSLQVSAVNDEPTFTLPGSAPTVAADAGLQTVTNFAQSITAGPADESGQTLTFTTAIVSTTGGLTFSTSPSIDGSGTLTYATTAGASGTATISVVLADNGSNVAPNDNTSVMRTFVITVTPAPVNVAPINALPSAPNVVEDQAVSLAGLSISDPDAGDSLRSNLAIPAATGTLTVVAQGGAVIIGNGTTALQIDGSATAINATLATLTYQPAANFNGATSLSITTTDFALSDTDTLVLPITPVNDEPTFSLAGNPPAITANAALQTVLRFATSIAAGPPDENTQTLTFTTTVTTTTGGLAFAVTPTIDVTTGTLNYQAAAGASGTATVTVVLSDSGTNTAPNNNVSPTRTFVITVSPAANVAPVITAPPSAATTEGIALAFTGAQAITVADSDADSSAIRVTLTIPSVAGRLQATATGGATISGNNSNSVVMNGSLAALNATLDSLVFTPSSTFVGPATLQIVANDLGNTGAGGARSDTESIAITVTPTTPPTGAPVEMIGNTLYVNGTNSADRIVLQVQNGVAVRFNNRLYSGFSPDHIIVYGNAGGDTITISNSLAGFPMEIYGGDGNDYIAGTSGADLIFGDTGNDRLLGGGGNDEIHGGSGRDSISGGSGNDFLDGGEDNDLINGEVGDDTLYGEDGNDRLNGGGGLDQLFGGSGTDVLDGGAGSDLLSGGSGSDALYSRDGNDVLIGGWGIDALNGGTGSDLLFGGDVDDEGAMLVWMSWQLSAEQVAFDRLDANAMDDDVADSLHGEGDSDWYLQYSDLFRTPLERKTPNKVFER